MKKLLTLVVALVLVFSVVASASAATYKLKIQVAEAETDPKAQFTKLFADRVFEETKGDVQIDVHYNSELGSLADVLEQISNGANIMVSTAIDQLTGYYADFAGPAIFYSLPTKEDIRTFAASDLFAEMVKNCEEQAGIKVLNLEWVGVPRVLMSVNPVKTFEDLKGLKIRGASSSYITFFENCGCSPETIAWNELYTALSQGLVEACEGNFSLLYTSSLYEVAKYITETNHYICPAGIFMNASIYNALPAEYQEIVSRNAAETGKEYSADSDKTDAEYRQKLVDAGVTILPWSAEDDAKMKEAGLKCWDNYPKLSEGLYERLQKALGK